MSNVSHFAGGGTATSTWQDHHAEALRTAILAGVHDSYPEYQDAMLIEAFGDHFLTDSFAAGHVRTPRAEIMAWYQNDFAPRALPSFITRVRARLRDGITRQLNSQMVMPQAAINQMVDAVMGGALAYFDDEIRTQFQPLFGLGISGAISGVLHDRDNERGLWVSSDAHPEPWLAYGDGRLVCSPTSAEQAKAAVVAAREELVKARILGENRREATAPRPIPLTPFAAPSVVYFRFDSAAVDSATTRALDRVSDFLVARPELLVEITGHTDPLGTDPYNDALAMRRADAVAGYLMGKGVAPTRLHTISAGEHQLLSAGRAGYPLNRRAELGYQTDNAAPDDLDWTQQVLAEHFPGPPYPTIERFVPREVSGRNDPQEDWQWGTMTSQMAAELDLWISHYVGSYRGEAVKDARLNDRQVPVPDLGIPLVPGTPPINITWVTIQPRPLVLSILDDLIASPTPFVGDLVGIPAANRSVPPLPPPVPCP
jgi:outer membrane protein OmpA-like peptidoglycan-associated protein